VSLATTGVAQAISSVTFTAGINTGGLQFVEVRGALAAACTCQASITVTPSAGSTAASPPSQSSPTTAFTGITTFEGGFTVPTGQSFTATLNVSGPAATSVQPVSLAINSAPRGNTVSSGRLS
jgi:hypothetical protein